MGIVISVRVNLSQGDVTTGKLRVEGEGTPRKFFRPLQPSWTRIQVAIVFHLDVGESCQSRGIIRVREKCLLEVPAGRLKFLWNAEVLDQGSPAEIGVVGFGIVGVAALDGLLLLGGELEVERPSDLQRRLFLDGEDVH